MATNAHLTHLEDLPLDKGEVGIGEMFEHLERVFSLLHNDSGTSNDEALTIKYDGAPAFFIGTDPEDGKFFVAKKSLLNKTPKVYKTKLDVQEDTEGDLRKKMMALLDAFSGVKLPAGKAYQGDLMYTVDDLKVQKIEGKSYITFQPNTIVYAFSSELPDAKKIAASHIGVVFHTVYTIGKTLSDLNASFSASIAKELKLPKTVHVFNPDYKDVTGIVNLPADISLKIESEILKLRGISKKLDMTVLEEIQSTPLVKAALMGYMNYLVKAEITQKAFSVEEFTKFMNLSKTAKPEQKEKILAFISDYLKPIKALFEFMRRVQMVKDVIIGCLNTSESTAKHFLALSAGGFEATTPEGYVAFKNDTSGAVKFVKRLDFSKANFNQGNKYSKGF